jgi:hypothetical protein
LNRKRRGQLISSGELMTGNYAERKTSNWDSAVEKQIEKEAVSESLQGL